MKSSQRTRALAVVLSLVTAFPGWMFAAVKRGPELPDPGNVSVSKQDQERLGLQAVSEVYRQMPALPDSSTPAQYINQIGQRLMAVIPAEYNWPYQFHVIQQKGINAFALPGGPVFVNLGTILAADNEAELAGVIAHEMAHVYMQHSIKAMQKQRTTQVLGQLLGGILGGVIGGPAGALANMGAQMTAAGFSMKFSRADEAQADVVGAIIMYKAGYDPHYLAKFFQKLEQEGGSGGPQFLSDHPNPGNRYQLISDQVKDWPLKSYRNDTPEFQQVRASLRNMRAYTAQEIAQMQRSGQIRNTSGPTGGPQGPTTMGSVSRGDVMPSDQLQTLNTQGFSIDYPNNWQPTQDQQSGGVTIAPPAGATQGALAYGVLINPRQAQGATSLDDATQQLVQEMVQQTPGMRQTGSVQNIRVNGVAGRAVDLLGTSPVTENGRQLQEHDWLVTLPYGQRGLVYLVFVAPERDFDQLKSTYSDMLRTFRFNQ
jgi:Zn-dependent protease with chaperone function